MPPASDPAAARDAALTLLGLRKEATMPQIVQAYRRLARATHPDATGRTDPNASQTFNQVHDAYQFLAQQEPEQRSPTPDPAADPLPTAERRPRRASPQPNRFPSRVPIVAGPVIVTGFAEQRANRRRSR